MSKRFYFTVALVSLFLAGPLAAKNELPEVTEDGLHLQKQSRSGALYVKPEATLEHYNKIMLVDAYVAFKKDWQADYNRSRVGLGMDIKDKDMERIKIDVANEFRKVFTETLEKGGYEVVTETGYDVMIVRPAIINLEIAAPDLNTAGMQATIVSRAGSLTLYAELYDSVTSEKFAQVIDAQEAGDRGFGYRATRVTNRQALDQTVRHWAGRLVKGLDEAHGKGEQPE
jgi:hypothetical protein